MKRMFASLLIIMAMLFGSFAVSVQQAPEADAWSDSTGWMYYGNWPGSTWGNTYVQSNAWHCNTFWDKCSWATSSKSVAYHNTNRRWYWKNVTSIRNTVEMKAHGWNASLKLGSSKSVSISGWSSTKSASWTNYLSWIADLSGKADPSWTTTHLTTCSSHRIWSNTMGKLAPMGEACALG